MLPGMSAPRVDLLPSPRSVAELGLIEQNQRAAVVSSYRGRHKVRGYICVLYTNCCCGIEIHDMLLPWLARSVYRRFGSYCMRS